MVIVSLFLDSLIKNKYIDEYKFSKIDFIFYNVIMSKIKKGVV